MIEVAIFGSCVSRDAVALIPEQFETRHYTARQSWISATSKPTWAPPVDRLTSSFQKRMLRSDFSSSMLREMTKVSGQADLVLLDLVDERKGVIRSWPGRYVTLTTELANSGWLAGNSVIRRKRLPLGDPEHLELFETAGRRVREALQEAGAWNKTVLVEAPFASMTIEGSEVGKEAGMDAAKWDEIYSDYYRLLTDMGFRSVRPPEHDVVSSDSHKWGPAPFHYADQTSMALLNSALAAVGET